MASDRLILGMSTEGFTVAECELAACATGELPALIDEARRSGAHRLWVHCSADLTGAGFAPVEGYRSFSIGSCPAGDPLPVLDAATPRVDLWGNHVTGGMEPALVRNRSRGSSRRPAAARGPGPSRTVCRRDGRATILNATGTTTG